jgi:hypothetical protein
MNKKLNNLINLSSKEIYVFLYFFIFLVIGAIIFRDYGISIDEDNTRIIGFLSLEKIYNFFSINAHEITKIIESDSLAHSRDNISTSGVIFDLPMAYIEYIFKIDDSKTYFLLRHFFTFLIFFISTIYFYKIIILKYKSTLFALLGTSFLIFSPRIFGESFFNNKDIVLMSFFIVGIFYSIKFLENKNIYNAFCFALICSIIVNIRILGIVLPMITIFFYIFLVFRNNQNKVKQIINLFLFLLLFLLFSFIFWPDLWSDPMTNFSRTLGFMKTHFLNIYIFYLGEFIFFSNMPWHYHVVSIFVSTPIIYLFFFIIGFTLISIRVFKRLLKIDKNKNYKDIWRGNKELYDLIFLIIFLSVILIAVDTGKISYNGWRHLYFIYPCFILIALKGLFSLKVAYFKKKFNFFIFLIFLSLLPNILWMIKNHPYQNLYYNTFVKNNFNRYFEADYWGLTNKDALKIISNDTNEAVKVFSMNTSDLNLSKRMLNKENRNKINIVYNVDLADYVVNHYYDWSGRLLPFDYKVPAGFNVFKDIKINNTIVNSIYKRVDLN